MPTIWKKSFLLTDIMVAEAPGWDDYLPIRAPQGAQFLHVARQSPHEDGQFSVWYRCSPDIGVMVDRRLWVAGTGHRCPTSKYISTVLFNAGELALHFFDDGFS